MRGADWGADLGARPASDAGSSYAFGSRELSVSPFPHLEHRGPSSPVVGGLYGMVARALAGRVRGTPWRAVVAISGCGDCWGSGPAHHGCIGSSFAAVII